MKAPRGPLAARFAEHVAGHLPSGATLVVGVSGGVDSVVLLHLLRFAPGLPDLRLVAAHVDHGMRPDSAGDAAWVAGVCRAWNIVAEVRRLERAPAGEAEARSARYALLEEIRVHHRGDLLLTAHHADDQAETVLFRVLRGTGTRGLRGIAERRSPSLWRPLLPFTREEILGHARDVGLSWREDPTNTRALARNVLRHEVLPLVERAVAPGARRALRGLARRARDEEAAWRSLEPGILARLGARREEGGHSVDRDAFLALHPAVRARLLRGMARRLGGSLHDAGTRLAVEFTSSGPSGGKLPLGGGVWLRRDLDRVRVIRGEVPPPDRPLSVPGPEAGKGRAVLGGRAWDVAWGRGPAGSREPAGEVPTFEAGSLAFPLHVRGWRPGDRVRLGYGSKKLKKLFLEARVPAGDRHGVPVLVDATGSVLWVPGVARSLEGVPDNVDVQFHLRIAHAESD